MITATEFWGRIDRSGDGCWLWRRSLDSHGYGQLTVEGRTRLAHRLAFEFANGPIPEGLCVLHRCDVPRCCNPNHLFLGTKKDNSDDMIAKGRDVKALGDANASRKYPERRPRGETHRRAKLTEDQVKEIRTSGSGSTTLAKRFGISKTHVNRIRRGANWAVAAAAMLLIACSPAVVPTPPPEPTCADACAHLLDLGCESGLPTDEGASCQEVCENAESLGLPEIRWPRACVAAAPNCGAAEACP